jgi:hypothetical protein
MLAFFLILGEIIPSFSTKNDGGCVVQAVVMCAG